MKIKVDQLSNFNRSDDMESNPKETPKNKKFDPVLDVYVGKPYP